MKRKFSFPILSISFLILTLLVIFIPRVIKIKTIICVSQFGPCNETITGKFREIENQDFLKTKKDISNFLNKEIKISRFSTKYEFPNKLKVYIIEEKAFIALGIQGQEKYALINKDGTITSLEAKTLLPIVNLSNGSNLEFKVGEKVPQNILFAATIGYEVFRQYQTRLVILNSDSIEASINSIKVLFPVEGDIDGLLGAMNLILSRLNNGDIGFKMRQVDLRYKNPVVR